MSRAYVHTLDPNIAQMQHRSGADTQNSANAKTKRSLFCKTVGFFFSIRLVLKIAILINCNFLAELKTDNDH